ncbi:MAG: hypothetical protein ACM3O3_12895 [Syntrophothermus sp.]
MSLTRIDYLMLGINISSIEFDYFDEKYLPYIEGHNGTEYAIIKNGCDSEFCYYGIILKKSDYSGFDRTPVNVLFNSWMISKLRRNIYNTCNNLFDSQYDKRNVNLYLITEYC